MITDEIKAELKWNHGISPDQINTQILKEKTEKALDDFFNRYFKQIKHENEFKKKLKATLGEKQAEKIVTIIRKLK